MDDLLRVTLLANAGVLLRYGGRTLLLDGIQSGDNMPFSALPSQLWQEMLCGSHLFSHIDGLLFSHLHPDHFSCSMTAQYLRLHHNVPLFMPAEPLAEECLKTANYKSEYAVLLAEHTEGQAFRLSPEITVQAFRTKHLDRQFYHVPHFCYLISFGRKHVLFTADVDYTTERLAQAADIPLHAVFVNPLFFHALSEGSFFRGALRANHICVYHIPFAPDDQWAARPLVKRDQMTWDRRKGILHTLTEPLQELIL